MNVLQLVLLALETIAQVASNPALGLGSDGSRVATLVGLVAALGRRGDEAVAELREFTEEVRGLAEDPGGVDPGRWDALTARRRAQHEALQELRED